MRLIQHIPAFADGVEPKIATGTLGEILATPWVADWLRYCDGARFMRAETPRNTLMVDGTRDGKRWWWVVGFFDEPPTELPEWRGTEEPQK